jgi:hypothetical protein
LVVFDKSSRISTDQNRKCKTLFRTPFSNLGILFRDDVDSDYSQALRGVCFVETLKVGELRIAGTAGRKAEGYECYLGQEIAESFLLTIEILEFERTESPAHLKSRSAFLW